MNSVTYPNLREAQSLVYYFSKWPEAQGLHPKVQKVWHNSLSKQYAGKFTYIVCRITSIIFLRCSISTNPFSFGCAKRLISDQGREFINKLDTELQLLLGTEHRMTSAYHPQTNGLVEKFNHTIQSCLLKVVNENQNDWDVHLDPVLFAIRTSKHKSTGYTPYELVYKRSDTL